MKKGVNLGLDLPKLEVLLQNAGVNSWTSQKEINILGKENQELPKKIPAYYMPRKVLKIYFNENKTTISSILLNIAPS